MATEPIEGKKLVILVDFANGTTYGELICLTEATMQLAANVITAASRCGTTKFNGDKDRTIDINGLWVFNPESPKQSAGAVVDAFENDTRVGWLFGPETPGSGDEWFTGVDAIFSNVTIGAPQEGAATFTATMQLGNAPEHHFES